MSQPQIKSLTEVMEDLWDAGNCTGLDGWIGPARGAGEVDEYALQTRQRDVEKAMNSITLAKSWVLVDVADERARQHAKWGEQNHPNGTGCGIYPMNYSPFTAGQLRVISRMKTDRRAASGTVTYADILLEEVFEALAEDDQTKLRAELIQVAAVAVQWVEAIDRGKQ